MFNFGEKHPVLFEIILIIAAFLAAGVLSAVGGIFYLHPNLSSSIARIAVGLFLLFLYRRAFRENNGFFYHFAIVLPAFLFALWNLFYNLSSGATIGGISYFAEALITASAPAIFEEVLFRGIFIYNLKKKGHSDMECLMISSLLFSAIHFTNILGLDLLSVVLQLVYSFAVGMVLAAVYLKNRSLLQIMFVHFLIDFTNRIYVEETASSTTVQIVIFVAVLVFETVYALMLMRNKRADQ